MILVVAALGTGSLAVAATAQSDEPVGAPEIIEIRGAVSALGNPVGGPAGWEVRHPSAGRYELRFGDDVVLRLGDWASPASVTLRPTEPATWIVDFSVGTEPTDTAFTFTAVPRSVQESAVSAD